MQYNNDEWWEDIDGYQGRYIISNYGRIKRLTHYSESGRLLIEKILTINTSKDGYKRVSLNKYGKQKIFNYDKLIAECFNLK